MRQMRHTVAAMEDYAATEDRPVAVCLADVAASDVYVGIFAWRYGFVPATDNPEGRSITELEFRHAQRLGKPCFIFLLHEDVPWPPLQIERGAGAEKLHALRAELSAKFTVDYFRSKEDLARRVSTALHNYFNAPRSAAPAPTVAAAYQFASPAEVGSARALHLGPLVPKMCDRRQQENEFYEFFKTNLNARPGAPQIYVLPGEEGECHDSLVERLLATRVRGLAEKRWGARGVISFKTPSWADEGELIERQQELRRTLFAEFDPAYTEDDLSATALSRLPALGMNSLVVVRHRLHAARWDKTTKELIRWYVSYWSELKAEAGTPQFIVFLNVIYPRAKPGRANVARWREWWRPRPFDKARVEAELRDLSQALRGGPPFLVLKELMPVTQHEVKDWFSQYDIYDEKRRQELAQRIFTTKAGRLADLRSMADVEHELRTIHRDYVKERGY